MRGSKEEKGGNIKRVSCCFSSPALSSDTSPWTEKEGKHSTGFSASRGWYQTKHARCSFCPLEAPIWKCTVCSWQEQYTGSKKGAWFLQLLLAAQLNTAACEFILIVPQCWNRVLECRTLQDFAKMHSTMQTVQTVHEVLRNIT